VKGREKEHAFSGDDIEWRKAAHFDVVGAVWKFVPPRIQRTSTHARSKHDKAFKELATIR
jgi:hypothetical protein